MEDLDASSTRNGSLRGVDPGLGSTDAGLSRETIPGASKPSVSADHPLRRRILICVDRSAFAESSVPHAVWLAKTFGGAVTVVYVVQPRENNGRQTSDALEWEISRQEAQRHLERLDKEISGALGLPVDTRLEQGRPADRITDLAVEIGADVIVLGSRGEGEAPEGTLGRTAAQVLALARCSVFIAHSSSRIPAEVTPKHILVPLDGSVRTESVLPVACRIASAPGTTLLLVHAVQESLPTALLDAPEDVELARKLALRLEAGAKRYLAHLQQQLAREVPSVHTLVVRHPNERQCLLEISRREQSDLIVLSAHGSACDSGRSFGSVTAYLVAHVNVPVLILQDLPSTGADRVRSDHAKLAPPLRQSSHPAENA